MRRSWDWFVEKAKTKHAQMWLMALSFSESSFFLIPPDVLLIAMLSAGAGRWVYLSFITSLSSVLGAVFGYLIGAFVFVSVAEPLITLYGLTEEFAHVGELYTQGTFWVVLAAAFTPIPFKVFVLSGGFFTVPFIPFILASILGRSARFFLVGWLAHTFGPRAAESFIENFKYITFVFVVLAAIALTVYFDVPTLLF